MNSLTAFLLVVIGILVVTVVGMAVRNRKSKYRITELNVFLRESKDDAEYHEHQKNLAIDGFKNRLHQIHLRDFSEWLWDDDRFISAVRKAVDEARPAALKRYNTKKEAELKAFREKEAEATKRSLEIMEARRAEEASKPRNSGSSSSSGDTSAAVISMISMDTSFSMDSSSCSVDSGSCM